MRVERYAACIISTNSYASYQSEVKALPVQQLPLTAIWRRQGQFTHCRAAGHSHGVAARMIHRPTIAEEDTAYAFPAGKRYRFARQKRLRLEASVDI